MKEPLRKWEWVCAPCFREEKRDARARAAKIAGKVFRPHVKAGKASALNKLLAPPSEAAWQLVEKRNALQAWRHWLEVRAPKPWLKARRAALKAMGKGLTEAERFRHRYRSDAEFRLGQILRIHRRKRLRGRHRRVS